MLLWETFSCGSVPYPGISNNEAREKIESGYRMDAPKSCPPEVHQIMRNCWEYEPEDRPSFEDIADQLQQLTKKYK